MESIVLLKKEVRYEDSKDIEEERVVLFASANQTGLINVINLVKVNDL